MCLPKRTQYVHTDILTLKAPRHMTIMSTNEKKKFLGKKRKTSTCRYHNRRYIRNIFEPICRKHPNLHFHRQLLDRFLKNFSNNAPIIKMGKRRKNDQRFRLRRPVMIQDGLARNKATLVPYQSQK